MGWSGGAQQVLLLAGALRRKGHELILACQPGSEISSRAQTAGIPIEFVRMRQDYDLIAVRNVVTLVRKRGIEVLHAQHSTAHAIGLMAAACSGVPVFTVTRRVVFPVKKNLFSRLKYLSARINGYVAISNAVRDELQKAGIAGERIEIIPSVVDAVQASADEGAAFRQELGLANEPVITTVANYADFKGQDFLIKAAARVRQVFPKVQFVLAGRDTEKLETLVDQMSLRRTVYLLGFRKDVPRILAGSDLFVLPSLQEAAGTALREAMAAGLPCVGTTAGGIPESIQDGRTGLLVPPADEKALASALIKLLEAPDMAQELAKAGETFAREKFSLDSAAGRTESFYKRLLDGAQAA